MIFAFGKTRGARRNPAVIETHSIHGVLRNKTPNSPDRVTVLTLPHPKLCFNMFFNVSSRLRVWVLPDFRVARPVDVIATRRAYIIILFILCSFPRPFSYFYNYCAESNRGGPGRTECPRAIPHYARLIDAHIACRRRRVGTRANVFTVSNARAQVYVRP